MQAEIHVGYDINSGPVGFQYSYSIRIIALGTYSEYLLC